MRDDDPAGASDDAKSGCHPGWFETHTGCVYGIVPASPLPNTGESPLRALEALLLPALETNPCTVAFSGGRDSSVVLAVAAHLARREGLPAPVPVTKVYPNAPETDESQWQRLVVDHLGLSEWQRIELDDDHDLLGPGSRELLKRHGLLWPAPAVLMEPMLRAAAGGALLTGEGGDEVFGARRITPLVQAVRWHRPGRLPAAVRALAPRSARQRAFMREARTRAPQTWLRPGAYDQHLRLLAADAATEPLHRGQAAWWLQRRRGLHVGFAGLRLLASDHRTTIGHPLLDPRFLAAVAHDCGRWGYTGRTDFMLRLFGDLLPQTLLRRSTKVQFNTAYAGRHTHDFARRWDGTGVDPELVDPEAVREAWLRPSVPALLYPLIHQAWLATEGAEPGRSRSADQPKAVAQ